MKNIIEVKGIARARDIIKDVIMPTPSAVLEAAKLIAHGYTGIAGFGEVIVIDIGGATTDVHSVAQGKPTQSDVRVVGLPEPYVKRTVEGDLGLKYNIDTLVELFEEREILPSFDSIVSKFHDGRLPETEEETTCHQLLSCLAVKTAMDRHAGRIEIVYGPTGKILVQHGKDLTGVGCVIGTGGPLIFSRNPGEILKGVVFDNENQTVLKPRTPRFYLDEKYVFYAAGLLSQSEPELALNLLKKSLKQV